MIPYVTCSHFLFSYDLVLFYHVFLEIGQPRRNVAIPYLSTKLETWASVRNFLKHAD